MQKALITGIKIALIIGIKIVEGFQSPYRNYLDGHICMHTLPTAESISENYKFIG